MVARELDLVLLGATGFTGALTATYLAEHAPRDLRWGLAGRDRARLEEVRDGLGPDHAEVDLVVADVTNPDSVATLAGRARVVATTVGPYLSYGEPLVRACAEAGTDYVDLSGEPEFVDEMYVRYHQAALGSGARIVHACGFDSVPHDLGVRHAVLALAAEGPVTARGVVRASGLLSGGTFNSALTQFARGRQMVAAHRARRTAEALGGAPARVSRAVPGRPGRDPVLGRWLVPLPGIDAQVVARSGATLAGYGSSFTYSHYAGPTTLRYAVGGALAVGGLVAAAQIPPVRRWLGARVPPGSGPDDARRERSWFTVDVIAEGGGRMVHTRVSGGDPGYTETAKMLAESALCLALDRNPDVAGCLTTAQAMGEALTARLIAAGIRFDIR